MLEEQKVLEEQKYGSGIPLPWKPGGVGRSTVVTAMAGTRRACLDASLWVGWFLAGVSRHGRYLAVRQQLCVALRMSSTIWSAWSADFVVAGKSTSALEMDWPIWARLEHSTWSRYAVTMAPQ